MSIKRSTEHVALITGAANGLGKTMVLGLIARGITIAAVDRDEKSLAALREEAQQVGGADRLHLFQQDLRSFDADSFVDQVEREVGVIDILINNAGLGQSQIRADYHKNPPKFYEVSPSQWLNATTVNANAIFLLSRAVTGGMMKKGWGRIINITTSLGTMLRGGYCPYGPTKASAEALSAVMSADLQGTGITVNVLIPGGIANTSMIPPNAPFDRDELIQPDVMLPPLLWLISKDADAVTGQRYLASTWDPRTGTADAARSSAAPIGWRDLAILPITPMFKS